MVLDVHGEMLVLRIHRRALGESPRRERTAGFETEVVMQPPSVMLLNDEAVR